MKLLLEQPFNNKSSSSLYGKKIKWRVRKLEKKKKLSLSRKLALEFLYTPSCINKSFFASVSRMRIHGNIPYQHMVIWTIDIFWLFRASSRFGKELSSGWNIYETNFIKFRMDIFLHSYYPCLALKRGLVLLITYKRPRRRTTWQSGWRFLRVLMEDTTFIFFTYMKKHWSRQICFTLLFFGLPFKYKFNKSVQCLQKKIPLRKVETPKTIPFLIRKPWLNTQPILVKFFQENTRGSLPCSKERFQNL